MAHRTVLIYECVWCLKSRNPTAVRELIVPHSLYLQGVGMKASRAGEMAQLGKSEDLSLNPQLPGT